MTAIHITTGTTPIWQEIEAIFSAGREVGRLYGDKEIGELRMTLDPAARNGAGAYTVVLAFDDPNDALVFKLAWRGEE